MSEATPERCEVEVGEPPHYFHSHQCPRRAITTTDAGRRLCLQHAKMIGRVHFVKRSQP